MLSLHCPFLHLQTNQNAPISEKIKHTFSLRLSLRRVAKFSISSSLSCPKPRSCASAADPSAAEKDAAEADFPVGLRRDLMPKHVAVIMDGNSRWARARGLPTALGHEAGVRALKETVKCCCSWGVKVLTVFAFSSENWQRNRLEVEFLMALFERVIKDEIQNFVREDIRVCVIGDSSKLSNPLHKVVKEAEELTKNNKRLDLLIALSYSGRDDIVQACKKIARRVKDGVLEPSDITSSAIEQELATNCTSHSHPDLLIRTSGEQRISNFLLWQSAYTELFFSQAHWPDFGEEDYAEALRSFQSRQRRFGGRILEQ